MSVISRSNTEESCFSVANVPLRIIEIEGLKPEVPALLVDCFDYILTNCLVEGIFRVPGSVKRMRDVTSDFGSYKVWLENSQPLPHDVSGVIKKFTRAYLDSIGGLFKPEVLNSLRSFFPSNRGRHSVLGSESYRSFSTSHSSGLECVYEDPNTIEDAVEVNSTETLDSIATLLVTSNSARKNALFVYFLSVLNCISTHQEQTRMPNANIAIVFQQYLFETRVVNELQSFQTLLEFLLDNYDAFVVKYRSALSLLGHFEGSPASGENLSTSNTDLVSVPFTESPVSPTSHTRVFRFGTPEENKRSSISQRLSSFWGAYHTPADRSKRFSFMSRSSPKSSARSRSSNRGSSSTDGNIAHNSDPERSPNETDSTPPSDNVPETEDDNILLENDSESSRILRYLSTSSRKSGRTQVSRNESKRKRFSAIISTDSMDALEVAAATPRTPSMADLPNIQAAGSTLLVDLDQQCLPNKARRMSLGRRFSIWTKRN